MGVASLMPMRRTVRAAAALALLAVSACSSACAGENGAQHKSATTPVAPTATPAPDPAPAAVEPGAVALTEDMAEPYFTTGVAGDAARAFALEKWQQARDGFARALAESKAEDGAAEKVRLRLLIALADSRLRRWPEAAAGLARAAAELPLLADFENYEAARAYYFAHDFAKAREHAAKVAADSLSGADAELLLGDLLRGRGRWQEVAAHYRKYLTDRPEGIRIAEARYRLAEALEKLGDRSEAADHYHRITLSDPMSKWAERADQRLAKLRKHLSAEQRKRLRHPTADQLIERGMAYYDAMRNPRSAADFEAALSAPGLTPDSACVAAYRLADSWFKERKRSKAAPLFDKAAELCRKTQNSDLLVKASYQGGRSYGINHQYAEAAERYATAEKDAAAAGSTYADDARLRHAEVEDAQGHDDQVTELLGNLPDLYPDGDMRAEAMWRLAWRAYQKGDYAQTVRWLDKQIATKPLEDKYYAEGQPQYWLGRTYARLGNSEKSIAAYQAAVRQYPLTYYALLALNRLREDHRDRFDALVKEISTPPAGYDPDQPAFQFRPRKIYGEPGFQRAMELLRLGLGERSEAELARLGLTPPSGREAVEDPDLAEELWAMAFLNHRAGRYQPSHWVTRWHVVDYKRHWPVGKNRARWDIAYPRAYWELLDKYAKQHGYPTALQIAIVREESAFDPIQESWANAIGLTQMIYPTATRFGKGTGIEITRENLRDPENNVIIGSNFLGFLWDRFDHRIALIPPSYNAGEHATDRWLRARGTWATDEWAEAIPGDQARNYSKRVIASFFVYTYLGDGSIPEMPNVIPKELIPKEKKKSSKPRKKSKRKRKKKERKNY